MVRTSCANTVWECQANRKALSMPPQRRSGGNLEGGWGLGGQRLIACIMVSVLATAMAKFQAPPTIANTSPANAGPTALAPL